MFCGSKYTVLGFVRRNQDVLWVQMNCVVGSNEMSLWVGTKPNCVLGLHPSLIAEHGGGKWAHAWVALILCNFRFSVQHVNVSVPVCGMSIFQFQCAACQKPDSSSGQPTAPFWNALAYASQRIRTAPGVTGLYSPTSLRAACQSTASIWGLLSTCSQCQSLVAMLSR